MTNSPMDRLAEARESLEGRVGLTSDFNMFVESIMRDEKGERIIQGDIHRKWFAHVQDCRKRGIYAGLLCPWGHGKSVNMAIAYPAWRLAQNQDLRIKIISASDEIARDRVSVIKSFIDNEESDYHRLFPHVQADPNRSWTGSKIYLKRKGSSPDPSIEAISILSSRMGARADLIVFDDVVDLQNAIQKPIMRDKIKDAFRSGWLSRIEPGGEVVYIGTVWHEDDLSMDLLSNERFSFCVQSISDDFNGIVCRYTNLGKGE